MLYTEATKKAMRLAYRAHHGQMDLGGVPYIFHPYHLAEQMHSEETVCAALLHDVLEDTPLTVEDLEREGFSPAVIQAVVHLTHDPAVPYETYVQKLSPDPIARAVKWPIYVIIATKPVGQKKKPVPKKPWPAGKSTVKPWLFWNGWKNGGPTV